MGLFGRIGKALRGRAHRKRRGGRKFKTLNTNPRTTTGMSHRRCRRLSRRKR